MSRGRDGSGLLLASVLVAFALQLGPLPAALAPFRPYWPALVLCYWLLEAPDLKTRAELLVAITEIELSGANGDGDITMQ